MEEHVLYTIQSGIEPIETDPRIARVEKHLGGIDRLVPGFSSMHPMGARLPQECVAITQHEFASLVWPTTHRVPSYAAWLNEANHGPVYEAHRRWLQYLQWKVPARRWMLKSPGHLWTLDALLREYPDARIVQTHRDPLRVLASLMSLVCTLRSVATDDIDQGVGDRAARAWSGHPTSLRRWRRRRPRRAIAHERPDLLRAVPELGEDLRRVLTLHGRASPHAPRRPPELDRHAGHVERP